MTDQSSAMSARTQCLARSEAVPGTRAGVYVDPDLEGVLLTVTDGKDAMQLVMAPDEAVSLASMIYRLAVQHGETGATSN